MIRTIRYTSPLKDVSDYIVLDTETTGVDPQSDMIIEVGLIEIRNNVVVDRFSSFVNPGRQIPAAASRVNHIYDTDVADAPTYAQIAPTLARWLIGKVVVAHNAYFDITLVKGLLESQSYTGTIRYIDTLYYARRTIRDVDNYKLQTLAAHLGIDSGNAHRAVDDALTCHQLFQVCKQESADTTLSQKPVNVDYDVTRAMDVFPSRSVSPDSPLYEKIVVFTGELSIPRREAMQMAVDAGAILKDNLTLDANYLVVGKQDPNVVGSGGKSRKQLRAAEINASGKGNIKIIQEAKFRQLCKGVPQKDRTARNFRGNTDQSQLTPKPEHRPNNMRRTATTPVKERSAMKIVWIVLQWILSAVLLLMALGSIRSSILSALLFSLCAVLSAPIQRLRDLQARAHIKSFWVALLFFVIFLSAMLVFPTQSPTPEDAVEATALINR